MSLKEDLPNRELPNPEDVVLDAIKTTPKSIHDVSKALSAYGPPAERLAREVVLKLIEEGKAQFNDKWFIENL